ncbi:hypothetical protein EDD36DRAFT_413833 [Exophiala viscosa]|uniref:Uncharacterized protein n=1 Tax=Exophiala viscosa TaxID=2486360 RepID=A0AAN6E7L3_9EURO|nr:hypothetical protein EDD36DRAFT_413833 [Exophiala viscosa]
MTTAASSPGDRLLDLFTVADVDPDPDPPPEPDPEAVADAGEPVLDEALACVTVGTTEFAIREDPVDPLCVPVDSTAGLLGEMADEEVLKSLAVKNCAVVPDGVELSSTLPLVVTATVFEPPFCVLVIVSMLLADVSRAQDCAVDVGGTCAIDNVVVSAVVVIRLPGAVTMLASSLATLLRGFNGDNMSRCRTGMACAAQQVN